MGWRKWKPSDPTSPTWYTVERFERLIAAYIAHGAGGRLVRDFIAEFDSLAGTAKLKGLLEETGLARAPLSSLVADG